MSIDPRWLDVDVAPPGEMMGCNVREDLLGSSSDIFEDKNTLIPRNEWSDIIAQRGEITKKLIKKIKDQGQEGSCASNATAGALEAVWNFQFGVDNWVELSAMSLYKRVGRSAGSGSSLSDNLREAKTRGILPVSNKFEHFHPERGFNLSLPSGWEKTAAQFRIDEYWDIASFEGLVTAVLKGYPVVYGRAGHAIYTIIITKSNNGYYLKYNNSWRPSWGDEGYGYDSERYVSNAIASYGAFAIRTVVKPSFIR